jgi:hypothetical protein
MSVEQVENITTVNLPAGGILNYALNNSKDIQILTDAPVQEVKNSKDDIIELTTGNFRITVGENFQHGRVNIPSPYLIKYIKKVPSKKVKNVYIASTHQLNLTSQYILPCLGLSKSALSYGGYMINTYLLDDCEQIGIVYRFSKDEGYGRLENDLSKSKLFNRIDNSIEGFDLILMNIPKEFKKDIPIFAHGGYSKLSNSLKEKIVEFHGLTKKDYIFKVIYKDEELRKKLEKEWQVDMQYIELAQFPNLDYELLKNQEWIKKD